MDSKAGAGSRAARAPSHLRVPLEAQLLDPLKAGALERIWAGVDARLHGQRFAGFRGVHAWQLGLTGAGLCALLLLGPMLTSGPGEPATPLLLGNGAQIPELRVAAGTGRRSVRFSDGSQIAVDPSAVLRGLASTPFEVLLLLERGRAQFSIVPGGSRRWVVEAKLGRVEVIGTEFTLELGAAQLRVRVARGAVLVRSGLLADGVHRVEAGGSVVVRQPTAEARRAAPERGLPVASAARADSAEPVPPEARKLRQTPTPDATGARAHAQQSTGAAALMAQADEARVARQYARAEKLLSRVLSEHSQDPRAPVAAFNRGVLQLQHLGQPQRASHSFRTALSGLSQSLREDCYLRWLEAELRAGRRHQAREVSARYLAEFPQGRHRATMQRLLGHADE